MDKDFELKYHEIEQSHRWFKGRRDMIFNLIKNEDKNSMILDFGCAGGGRAHTVFTKKGLYKYFWA